MKIYKQPAAANDDTRLPDETTLEHKPKEPDAHPDEPPKPSHPLYRKLW